MSCLPGALHMQSLLSFTTLVAHADASIAEALGTALYMYMHLEESLLVHACLFPCVS